MDRKESTILRNDDNIDELRAKYPDGLHFVVGDTHTKTETLKDLMAKIKFDPKKDHVYFVGDYNGGGDPGHLLGYMSLYYSADCGRPGFHLIRGNHERELFPVYPLYNLPDILVIRGNAMNYFIVHAGMVSSAFKVINEDMAKNPDKKIYAYKLDNCCTDYNSLLKLITWSRNGLYSQKFRRWWPSEAELHNSKACIIHGHSPYCFFMHQDYISYGDECLFWQNQHMLFSEPLQSFNIDSDVKGRNKNGETYRGLSCVCLEIIDEIAEKNNGWLTIEGVASAPNFVFAARYIRTESFTYEGNTEIITNAQPLMKTITLDVFGNPIVKE